MITIYWLIVLFQYSNWDARLSWNIH